MDFDKEVENAEERLQQLKASASAAVRKNQKQLKKKLIHTQADTGQVLSEAKQELSATATKARLDANAAAETAQGQLAKVRADALSRVAELKAEA